MSNIRKSRAGLTVAAGLCAFMLSAGFNDPAALAQNGPATVGVTPQQEAAATPSAAKSETPAKPADLYFVEFRARAAASYGHSFVVHGRLNGSKRIAATQVAGLHPATESSVPWMIGHVFLVPSETGASDGDTEDQYVTAKYRIVLNKARYDKAVAAIKKLQDSSPVWHAVLYNCNAFIGDIATAMGLKVPPSTMVFPKEYVTTLRQLNGSPRRAVAMVAPSPPVER